MTALVGSAVAYRADAIHPGYGFLAENASFAKLCEREGIVFVGPPSDVIRRMGDKIEARAIARAAGAPTIAGSEGAVSSIVAARDVAERVGFPMLVKAAAGGGGRGMRVIGSDAELERGLSEAMSEAEAAFGDGSVYVEKFLTDIRHIEVQVLSDGYTSIHLGERDCTSQRRNQKLVEEAPSTALSAALRLELFEAAKRICTQVGYKNAGTIEFVLDNAEQKFYFIEMNTRIQVEHPVTEMITGIDIVKQQLSIANETGLLLRQEDVEFRGHAIECRVNAEDPDREFLPCPGVVSKYLAPGGPGIRTDSHLEDGYRIPPFYDSMVAKVIAWGNDRQEAIDRMTGALSELQLEGVKTTIPLHLRILRHPRFRSGEINTGFVAEMLSRPT
jgi:acetyl-CoA carboxylase biotin carboxylase subunit